MAVATPTGGKWVMVHGNGRGHRGAAHPVLLGGRAGGGGKPPGGGKAKHEGKTNFVDFRTPYQIQNRGKPGVHPGVGSLEEVRAEVAKHGLDLDEVAAALCPGAEQVTVGMTWRADLGQYMLKVSTRSDAVTMDRTLDLKNKTVENDYFQVTDKGKGRGSELFAEQAERSAALGLTSMKTYAARSNDMNGYYTWARLGYDGPIKTLMRTKEAPPGGATRVSDLMRTPEGRAWWKNHGSSVDLEFDLRPGSYSRTVLAAYMAEKQRSNA